MQEFEEMLWSHWTLSFKPSSKLYMLPAHHCEVIEQPAWKRVGVFPVLGHQIEFDTCTKTCVSSAFRCAWGAFWNNICKSLVKHCPKQVLLSRLTVFVLPIFSYRGVRWPHTKSLAKRIDTLQRKMICIILGVRKLPHESPDAFRRRRGKMAAQTQRKAGLWSNLWGCGRRGARFTLNETQPTRLG